MFGGYNTRGHVNLFHLAALTRLLARAGLTVIDADGLYSSNPVELVAFLGGRTRGAFDALTPPATSGTLPAVVSEALNAAWPGAALLERLALASPILQVVACRTGREGTFAPGVAERQRRRRDELAAEGTAMVAAGASAAALQREIDRRDALLEATTQSLQREVDRRDLLLRDAQQGAQELQRGLAAAQEEINVRDALPTAVRHELDQTVDARVRKQIRRLRRMARRS